MQPLRTRRTRVRRGGGRRLAEEYGVGLLGQLPLDIRIREQTDSGRPTVGIVPWAAPGATWPAARRPGSR